MSHGECYCWAEKGVNTKGRDGKREAAWKINLVSMLARSMKIGSTMNFNKFEREN